MSKLISGSLIHVKSVEMLDCDGVRSVLRERMYVVLRGLFSSEEVLAARSRVQDAFCAKNDQKHDPKDTEAVRRNLQKLVVGGTGGVNSVPRFLRMFYNPTFQEDIYRMRGIFTRLIRLRNVIYGLPLDFTVGGTENGLWTASRVNHYPRGGGFMAPHVDVGTATISREIGMSQYLQLIMLMSKKGIDYMSGGAYIEIDQNRCFFEDDCEIGDVVIYDGRIRHGVEDVDPMEPLDLSSFAGRHVALVTLFKHFRENDGLVEYGALMER